MRHAKSSWKYPDLSDHERPLKKRGRKASVKIAKELMRLEWIPNKLFSSDSERTWKLEFRRIIATTRIVNYLKAE